MGEVIRFDFRRINDDSVRNAPFDWEKQRPYIPPESGTEYMGKISRDKSGHVAEEAGKIAAESYTKMLERKHKRIVMAVSATLLALGGLLVLSRLGSDKSVINKDKTACYYEGAPDGLPVVGPDGEPTCEGR